MDRPEYQVARSCRTCLYFDSGNKDGKHLMAVGTCRLPMVQDPKATPWPAHAIGVCPGHTWKARGRNIQKVALKFNMTIPEDTL